MTIDQIILYGYVFIIFSLLYITYLIAKKFPKITLENLAFCLIFFTFNIQLLSIAVQFYLIWKLYFSWTLKQDDINGNDNINK